MTPVVAVAGPTGAGKSELALRVAEKFNGEVVNCDSLQIYRYFDIGTAKLTVAEMRGIPHHLIDILDPDEIFTAGEFARQARGVLAAIASRGKLPVVAGGTGFYLRALFDGLFRGPGRDDALRERLAARERHRPGSLHRLLTRLDANAAARIHANDIPKVMRALEICLLARRSVTDLYAEGRDRLEGYRVLKMALSPNRDALYTRLDERCRHMFENGLAEEVRSTLDRGFPAECKPFEAHGYRQVIQMLRGELDAKQAVFYAQRNTRNYAKRQMTWFRKETGVEWLHGFGDEISVQETAFGFVEKFLRNS
jgi:tRNA dimethylallyltransferase